MNLYCISGLGADESVFRFIRFPKQWTVIHIPWKPLTRGMDLPAYAYEMAKDIDDSQPFALCGVSFGGMLCSEISKFMHPQLVILLSSAAVSRELPFIYKLGGRLHLEKFIPLGLIHHYSKFLQWIFGPLDALSRNMFKQIVQHGDPQFIRRALGIIGRWKNTRTPPHMIQIHGADDRVLWPANSRAGYKIPHAGHLFMLTHARALNRILESALAGESLNGQRLQDEAGT